MDPIRWLTVSAAATRLGCTIETVQEMADAGYLRARWIHDHLSICEKSVQERTEWAAALAAKYRTNPPFIHRLAEYSRRRRAGADEWVAASGLGITTQESAVRYERWLLLLGEELRPDALIPRDPRNPAEDEMTPNDNETYREEQSK